MKRILTFIVLLMRGAIRPAPVIDGKPYHFGVWSSITLAWFLSDNPALQAFQWLPTQLRRIGHFFAMVWRPCTSDEDGRAIRLSIACAWEIAADLAQNPKIEVFHNYCAK